jgi:hypothetical protein
VKPLLDYLFENMDMMIRRMEMKVAQILKMMRKRKRTLRK